MIISQSKNKRPWQQLLVTKTSNHKAFDMSYANSHLLKVPHILINVCRLPNKSYQDWLQHLHISWNLLDLLRSMAMWCSLWKHAVGVLCMSKIAAIGRVVSHISWLKLQRPVEFFCDKMTADHLYTECITALKQNLLSCWSVSASSTQAAKTLGGQKGGLKQLVR